MYSLVLMKKGRSCTHFLVERNEYKSYVKPFSLHKDSFARLNVGLNNRQLMKCTHLGMPTLVQLSVSLFPVDSNLVHRASVTRFVSLQFLNPKTVGRTPWTGDQPVARPLPTQDNTNTE
jgi:hypothetical protein